MQDLIERLEKATEHDYDLDYAILAVVDPQRYAGCVRRGEATLMRARANGITTRDAACRSDGFSGTPMYTWSLDAAATLVPEGRCYDFAMTPNGPCATVWEEGMTCPPERYQIKGPTPAIALCLAALKARQAQCLVTAAICETKGD